MRWLAALLAVTGLGLGAAGATDISVLGNTAATGSGAIVSPPLSVTEVQFFPDSEDITRLDFVRVTIDRIFDGGDVDTTPGSPEHFDLYVQAKDASGNPLGNPRVVHDFGNGVDGEPKTVDVAFWEDNISIVDLASIAFTICGRHESGDGDFHCKLPP